MERVQLEQIFQQKIYNELKIFKCQMLLKSKEEIVESAYKIVCMTGIYEGLLKYSTQMAENDLYEYTETLGLLEFLFGEWLKDPDTPQEHSLWSFITQTEEGDY